MYQNKCIKLLKVLKLGHFVKVRLRIEALIWYTAEIMTVGVVTNSTKINNMMLIIKVLAHQLSGSTDKCSHKISAALGATFTFQ